MKLRYIVSMGGMTASYPAFETDNKGELVFYDVEKLEAVNLINAGYAVAKNEEEYKDALAEIEELKAKKESEKKLADNIANLDALKAKREQLNNELSIIEESIKEIEIVKKGK